MMLFRVIALLVACLISVDADAGPAEEEIRVLLIPKLETTLYSGMTARVQYLEVDLGDQFQQGDLLAAFDCAILQAEIKKAEIDLELARKTYEANLNLQRFQSISTLEVELSAVQEKRARATIAVMEEQRKLCELRAPFNGYVVKRHANPHERLSRDAPVLEILEADTLHLQLFVPSQWLLHLRKGTPFTIRIDETQQLYNAEVSSLGARVDPASQTLEIRAVLKESVQGLLAGMSGTASFKHTSHDRERERDNQ